MTEKPVPTTRSLAITAALAVFGFAILVDGIASPDRSWVTLVVGAVVGAVYTVLTARGWLARRRSSGHAADPHSSSPHGEGGGDDDRRR